MGHHQSKQAGGGGKGTQPPAAPTSAGNPGGAGAGAASKEVPLRSERRQRRQSVTGHESDVHQQYDFEAKELGHGHYGVVRLAIDKITGENFAIKTIRKAKVSKYDALRREIDILK